MTSEKDTFAHLQSDMALSAGSIESDLSRRVDALEWMFYRLLAVLRQSDFGKSAVSKVLDSMSPDERGAFSLEQIRERLRDWQF